MPALAPRTSKPRKVATKEAINKMLSDAGFYDAARQVLALGYGDVTLKIAKPRPDVPRDKGDYVVDVVTETSQRTMIKLKPG